jgi:tetratricopeptide (TPR) repeat protein/tRNA A-37 threonylcarbamoyl transferase component Bud32
MAQRTHQVEQLIDAARNLRPSDRSAFLEKACAGDKELRLEVESLLASRCEAPTLPSPPASGEAATTLVESAETEPVDPRPHWMRHTLDAPGRSQADTEESTEPFSGPETDRGVETGPRTDKSDLAPPAEQLQRGTTLGRYTVLGKVGAGGMGVVYAAYDPEIDRKVAIKLVKTTAADKLKASEGRARLLREAQAMARLTHPNIVAVHDVGTFAGQVFIVMEYVEGQTLRQWLEAKPRAYRQILTPFLQAGQALAAAHAVGLIHRDFKLENVLVARDGRTLVLDFGLARAAKEAEVFETATQQALAETMPAAKENVFGALLTRTGSLLGTPAYMAPEQLMGFRTDARVDQFSFCVSVYEGLYGERPFAGDRVETLVRAVTQGKVREVPKSSKVPARIRQALLRGLRPNPEERYPSMEALITELARDPAIARRRWAQGAAAVIVIGLSALGYRQVKNQQSQLCKGADKQLADVWNSERRAAIARAFLATGEPYAQDAVNSVQKGLDGYSRSWVAGHTEACEATRLRGTQSEDLLDLRMSCLSQRREELNALIEILTRADAKVVERSVEAVRALTPLDGCADAIALKAPFRPPDAATRTKVEELRKKLAPAKALTDAGKYREAMAITAPAAAEAKALHYRPLEAEVLLQLGQAQLVGADRKTGEQTLKEALLAAEAGADDKVFALASVSLVGARRLLGHFDDALESGRYAEAALERLGGNEKMLAGLLVQLGNVLNEQGKYEEALANHRRAQAITERLGGDFEPRHLLSFGWLLNVQGKLEDALHYYKLALETAERTLGSAHPLVAGCLTQLSIALYRQGKYELALAHLERARSIYEQTYEASGLAHNLDVRGRVLLSQGKYNDALECFQRSQVLSEQQLGHDSPSAVYPLAGIGSALASLGKYDQALATHRRVLASLEKILGPHHANVAASLEDIGSVLIKKQRYKEALSYFERARAVYGGLTRPHETDLASVLDGIADALRAQSKYGQALDNYQRAAAIQERDLGPQHPTVAHTLTEIGRTYLGLREPSKAIAPLERALSIYEAWPADPNELAETRFALARALARDASQRERAMRLASSARETFAAGGTARKEDVAAVDAWLVGKRIAKP